MYRSRGDMASPGHLVLVAAVVSIITLCNAGPLGPLPNVTSSDVGLKEGSCALGDVVYMLGDEFPGSSPCERCTCTGSGVQCAKQRCEPRPGCKALHRPDHCCPTYQCECEQEGRVYSNGEKLVDPADPCRVCYCQGGEVVCRRIACFVRDDCLPRLVPGRCCPEYDNCPLRGVTTVPGMVPSISSVTNIEDVGTSAVPSAPKENIKQEITIKEITPVSEIPVITEVKIKEILPSPSIEVAEYSSSKSPLIPREATSEKSVSNEVDNHPKPETPVVMEVGSSSSPILISSSSPDTATKLGEIKSTADSFPSKISLSTQDSINSEIYPSNIPNIVATMGSPSVNPEIIPVATTAKATMIEEEDTSLFDHNPAFPPLPDDLSVLSNHEDEIIPEPNADNEHSGQEIISVPSVNPSTEAPIFKESSTEAKITSNTTPELTTQKPREVSAGLSTAEVDSTVSTQNSGVKDPMLNLRSAIPTEILNVPSLVQEDLTGESDALPDVTSPASDVPTSTLTSTTTEAIFKTEEGSTDKLELTLEDKTSSFSTAGFDTTTRKIATTELSSSSQNLHEQTTNSIAKSNVATEVTSQTELSSLPIETSDQNPQTFDNLAKNKVASPTSDPVSMGLDTTKFSPISSEMITVSSSIPLGVENQSAENVETTEFILTSFGSSESTTDAVELIKISPETKKNAAIVQSTDETKNSVLNDLINLVGDVASISDHTDGPDAVHVTGASSISDSEELIPVNAGYKSKNNNWNLNSITEIPLKTKNQTPVNKQKVVEIEDDESDSITDSPPPNDKVEPTTRRPIIDNVSADDVPENKTEKKDIEIITQSYVPTINKRPTKVVMKKNNEKPVSEEAATLTISSEVATEFVPASQETATVDGSEINSSIEGEDRSTEQSSISSNSTQ